MDQAERPALTARLTLRLTPNASRDEVKAVSAELVEVRLRAPAIEGRANRALIEFLAAKLRVRPRAVSLDRGAASRLKVVAVEDLDLTEALRRLRADP